MQLGLLILNLLLLPHQGKKMETKICNICKEMKSLNDFSLNRSRKDGHHYNCKKCDLKKAKDWYQLNKDTAKTRSKIYRDKNKETHLERDKDRYYLNRENELQKRKLHYNKNKDVIIKKSNDWISVNRVKHNSYMRNHYENNKPYYKVRSATRRALKINATPFWLSAIQLAQIQEIYDIATARSVQTGVIHHVDHIHPLHGDGFNGLHVPWNLQVITKFENLSKGCNVPIQDNHLFWKAS